MLQTHTPCDGSLLPATENESPHTEEFSSDSFKMEESEVERDIYQEHEVPLSTEKYVAIFMLAFLSVTGTAGNLLVLYVFSQKKDKLVSTLFILVLAFVDFTTCLIVLPYTIYMEYVSFLVWYDFLCKLYQFLITANIPFSVLVMVAIAIDRYFCICHPFLHALNMKRAKIMVGCLAIFACGIGVIVALLYGVYSLREHEVWNSTETAGNLTGLYGNTTPPMETVVHKLPEKTPGAILTQTATYEISGDVAAAEVTINVTSTANVPDNDTLREVFASYGYTGRCAPSNMILSMEFLWYFQKFYSSLYLLCLIIVIVLYSLIYRSVLARRSKRQKAKSKSLHMVQIANERANGDSTCTEETLLTSVNGETLGGCKNGATKAKDKDKDKYRRKSTKKDKNRIANLKTAAMLFVVTVVFIVTFMPAFLMALALIPQNLIVFYLYFANNVANPVIYAFMNKNFRDDLRKLFCGRR